VGAFAIALGLIAANFDEVKAAVLRVVPGLGNVGKIFGELVTKVTDFVGITNKADRALEKFTKTSERKKEALEGELKIQEASGASQKTLSELQTRIVNEDLNKLRFKLKTKGELNAEEQKKFRELNTELTVIDAKYNKSVADQNKQKNEKVSEQNKVAQEKDLAEFLAANDKKSARLNELSKSEKTDFEKKLIDLKTQYDADLKLFSDSESAKILAKKTFDEAVFAATKAEKERIKNLEDKEADDKIKKLDKEREQKQKDETKTRSLLINAVDKSIKISKEQAEAQVKIAEEEQKGKRAAAQGTADTLANLSNLLGQETAAGKAAAVASATISAILSAQKAYESTIGIPFVGPVLAPINAGLALASGYKSIQSILSVQVPGQSGGGSAPGLPSAPDAGAGAPIAPRAAEPTATTLDSKSLNTISNVVSRAYVVESDITGSQQRISRIEKAARF
jgi:hypothetical protein